MKFLQILLVSTAAIATVQVEAKVPEFIHTCKRDGLEFSKCVEDSILNMRGKLVEGIPELGLGTIDPMNITEMKLNFGPGIKAVGKNLQLLGLKSFQVKNLVADLDTHTYSFDLSVPKIQVYGEYELEMKIVSILLKSKGPVDISSNSVSGRATLHGKKVVRHGQTRYYYPSMDMKLHVGDFQLKMKELFEGNPQIGEVMNKLLTEERDELLTSILPTIEKVLINHVLDYSNNLVKHYTWDELYPES